MNTNKLITIILKRRGFREVVAIEKDEFDRYHGIVSDSRNRKYFIKAVFGKNTYGYKSLTAESEVSAYLSGITEKNMINHKGYTIKIPKVKKIVKDNDLVMLISEYIKGKRLLDENSRFKAKILITAIELVTKLSTYTGRYNIKPYLKDYSKNSLLLYIPLRITKALVLMPSLFKRIFTLLPSSAKLLLNEFRNNGLIHADINASNIVLRDKTLYLTDWEEAGWGVSEYNLTTPLCVHWEDKVIRNTILRYIHSKGLKNSIMPLLSCRILALLNQNYSLENVKRVRDLKLLNLIPSTEIKITSTKLSTNLS